MRSLLAVNSALSLSDGGDLACVFHIYSVDLGFSALNFEEKMMGLLGLPRLGNPSRDANTCRYEK